MRPPPPVMSSTVACAMSSTPSDATSFDSGDELRSGRKTDELHDDAERDRRQERQDHRRRRPQRRAAEIGAQPQEQVAGDHRVRAGGDVDDPRSAVGQHDAEADPCDERARPQTQEREEEDLLDRVHFARRPPSVTSRTLPRVESRRMEERA